MITKAYNDLGWVGNDMYAPYDPGYPKDLPQREQDLAQAKSLLKAAGYDNNLTVELDTSDAVGGGAVAAAQVFAEQAKGAGVTVKVNKIADAEYFGDKFLKYAFGQDFYYTRGYLAQASLNTMPGAVWNETHWKNDKWLALVKEAFVTVDEAKRNELIGEAQKIEYDDGGLIVWGFNDQVDAYSAKLGGVVPYKSGVPLSSFHFNDVYFA
jgi:peptide/nickel transport system substrate-binding protein